MQVPAHKQNEGLKIYLLRRAELSDADAMAYVHATSCNQSIRILTD